MGGFMKNNILLKIVITFLLISVTIMIFGWYEKNYLLMIIGILFGVITNIINVIRYFKRWNKGK
jgi:hypothetical protein